MLSTKLEKPGDKEVQIWGISRSMYNDLKSCSEYVLNEDEQNRARRFRFRKQHDMFVIGRYITRILLAYYNGCTPENVKIIPDSFGKPKCDSDLFFNISHSGDQLLLGFSKSEIGVDIEWNNPAVDIERVGKRHFSEIEFQKIMSCTEPERIEAFFEIWTKKESLIKGIGKGLSIPLQEFDVTNCNGKVLWEVPNRQNYGNWYVHNIETKHGFKSAFATQMESVDLSYFPSYNW